MNVDNTCLRITRMYALLTALSGQTDRDPAHEPVSHITQSIPKSHDLNRIIQKIPLPAARRTRIRAALIASIPSDWASPPLALDQIRSLILQSSSSSDAIFSLSSSHIAESCSRSIVNCVLKVPSLSTKSRSFSKSRFSG
jgi:hypothetical protein